MSALADLRDHRVSPVTRRQLDTFGLTGLWIAGLAGAVAIGAVGADIVALGVLWLRDRNRPGADMTTESRRGAVFSLVRTAWRLGAPSWFTALRWRRHRSPASTSCCVR